MNNIENFAKKPALTRVVLDDPELIASYGEDIGFYMYDNISVSKYFEYLKAQTDGNVDALEKAMRSLVLKEDGTPAIPTGYDLPADLGIGILTKLNLCLGKLNPR